MFTNINRTKNQLLLLMIFLILFIIYYNYLSANIEAPDYMLEIYSLVGLFAGFSLGYLGRNVLNFYLQQEVRIMPELFWFDQRPYIAISNRILFDVIEVKVGFELMEPSQYKEPYASLILKCAENISLTSIPAREKKLGERPIYVEIPQKLLERWERNGRDDNVMFVRATSVHLTTNFRAITETVKFEWKDVANQPPVAPEQSSRASGSSLAL